MVENKQDARIIRTRQTIRRIGLDLMTSQPDFSISTLLDRVKITRGTFYRHYRNKEDLVADINRVLIEQLSQHTQEQFRVARVIAVISERAVFYNSVLNQQVDQIFYQDLMTRLRAQMRHQLAEVKDDSLRQHLAYQWEAIVAGFFACVAKWLDDSMNMSQPDLLNEFAEIWRLNISTTGQTGLQLFDFTTPA
ncbi:TetR/AcrR family transcriptional regulator [Leuconostocaceae bacterium ESL0723]|nr:TetR/AcrR family transcriptional regulator [Lactobacillaceae bacterium L1_55_11]WEV55050.1 TetR/AcrR family transcriptional regulator [Leuconostocaceae bacterium ESL0723]